MPCFSRLRTFCSCCLRSSREKCRPVPDEGTPAWEMMRDYGYSVVFFTDIWFKYTRGNDTLQFPKNGTFNIQSIVYLEQCLLEKKARQAMWDAFRSWEKEAIKRQKKKNKLYLKGRKKNVATKLQEYKQEELDKKIQQNDREYHMRVDKVYFAQPLLPSKDPIVEELLDGGSLYPMLHTVPSAPRMLSVPQPAYKKPDLQMDSFSTEIDDNMPPLEKQDHSGPTLRKHTLADKQVQNYNALIRKWLGSTQYTHEKLWEAFQKYNRKDQQYLMT